MEKRIAEIADCLLEINPEIKFTYLGEDYDTLQILSDHEKPTKEAIESAKVKAQKKIDDVYYKVQRSEAYDPIPKQLDQIYWDMDGWKARIKSVKDKYPKPT
tara:strand:+ start:310 stop:615 length:306 start_codon:yes stop_codon:yes gene_type:complete